VGHLTIFDIANELFITVLSFDEGNFIVPPLESLPVIFTILKELSEEVRVLTASTDDRFLRSLLVPFYALEGKAFDCLGNVHDGLFFSFTVLEVNLCSFSIIVLW